MKLVITFLISLLLIPLTAIHAADIPAKKPNIVWFVVDDMSAIFSRYGEKLIQTPHVDQLAREGTGFAHAHLQPNAYKDGKSIVQTLRSLHDKAQLDPLAESLLFSSTRPAEELYEWTTDRWQVTNLAAVPAHRATLEQLRARLDQWMLDTHDHGPESDAMYDSDMAAYVGNGNPVVERNIALMKQWAKADKVPPANSKAK